MDLSCTQCDSGFLLFQEICLTTCPLGSFKDSPSSCVQCPINCTSCVSLVGCTGCMVGLDILFNGKCLDQCPEGFVVLQIVDKNYDSCKVNDTIPPEPKPNVTVAI